MEDIRCKSYFIDYVIYKISSKVKFIEDIIYKIRFMVPP